MTQLLDPANAVATKSADAGELTAELSAPKKRRKKIPLAVWIWGALAFLLIVVCIIGPWIVGDTTIGDVRDRLLPMGKNGHLLGTDGQGRDILDRLIAGARPSLLAGLLPVIIAGILGTGLGVASALAGKAIHTAIMRTLDVFYAFPAVLLAIAIGAALGSGTTTTIICLSVVLTPPIARIAETETMRIRDLDYLDSARASGAGRLSIAVRQVLPAIGPHLLVYCTSLIGLAVVFAGGLSFLGLGVAPPSPEWGQMINDQRQYMIAAPAVALAPAIMIFIASLIFNLLGDGLRDMLDVKREGK